MTPEEFVAAGDHLGMSQNAIFTLLQNSVVSTCPTWSWNAGESDKTKPFLPEGKQFLITKQVPCHKRCKDIQYSGEFEKIIDGDEDGDGGKQMLKISASDIFKIKFVIIFKWAPVQNFRNN